MLEKLRILDLSEFEFSLLVGESSTTDKRLSAEADGRLRMVGSEILAMVLSIAAAAKANNPPDFGFLVVVVAVVEVEPVVEGVNWS